VTEVQQALEADGFDAAAALRIATQLVAEWRGLQLALLSGAPRAVLDESYADLIDRIPLP
jgi:hypothetical protein